MGRLPSVTLSFTSLPSRLTTTSTLSPGLCSAEALHVVVDRGDRLAAEADDDVAPLEARPSRPGCPR